MMLRYARYVLVLLALPVVSGLACESQEQPGPASLPPVAEEISISLPPPEYDGSVSLEQSLLNRRSVRDYADAPLTLEELSQLFWAAQGVTDARGYRTSPSAGALYPLELYAVVGDIENAEPGIYRYRADEHDMVLVAGGDRRTELAEAALSQSSVREGAAAVVVTAVYARTTAKYGDRGIRYVHIEVGHAAQNICLQAAALGLGTVTVGAFDDAAVAALLRLPEGEMPLYILPVGRKPGPDSRGIDN